MFVTDTRGLKNGGEARGRKVSGGGSRRRWRVGDGRSWVPVDGSVISLIVRCDIRRNPEMAAARNHQKNDGWGVPDGPIDLRCWKRRAPTAVQLVIRAERDFRWRRPLVSHGPARATRSSSRDDGQSTIIGWEAADDDYVGPECRRRRTSEIRIMANKIKTQAFTWRAVTIDGSCGPIGWKFGRTIHNTPRFFAKAV